MKILLLLHLVRKLKRLIVIQASAQIKNTVLNAKIDRKKII